MSSRSGAGPGAKPFLWRKTYSTYSAPTWPVAITSARASRTWASPKSYQEHIEAAWAVVEYSSAQAEVLVGRLRESDLKQAEARVLAAAGRIAASTPQGFTRRDVRQRVKGRTGMGAATFNAAFDALVRADEIVHSPNSNGTELWMLSQDKAEGPGDQGNENGPLPYNPNLPMV